jgi:hypothetical protein
VNPIAPSIVAAVLLAASTTNAAATTSDTNLLERYRPLLRYDVDERYQAQRVSLPAGSAERRIGNRVYGRVASEDGETWLQYWFFYAYNPQDRGIVATGRHEGDWELTQLRLGDDGTPAEAVFAQHSWAERCPWTEIETAGPADEAPVIYIANGSHAAYTAPGTHDRPFPDPNDEADGAGAVVRPILTPIDETDPAWVAYSGRWGDSEAGWVPGESSRGVGVGVAATSAPLS